MGMLLTEFKLSSEGQTHGDSLKPSLWKACHASFSSDVADGGNLREEGFTLVFLWEIQSIMMEGDGSRHL